jgi:hypothetical protein
MSDAVECPECKIGHLRPTGKHSKGSDTPGNITSGKNMTILECDNCGHKLASASLDG